jgi:hypothetical protein
MLIEEAVPGCTARRLVDLADITRDAVGEEFLEFNVVNSGTITATAVLDASAIPEESSASGYGVGIAVGIYRDGELMGNLTNSGTITATAERLESSGSEPPLVCWRLITSSHATISNALNCA